MTELPPIESLDLKGSAETPEIGGEDSKDTEDAEDAEEVETTEVALPIEAHRCQTVFDFQQRFCDQEFIPEFTLN